MDSKTFNTRLARSLDRSPKQVAELTDALARILCDSAKSLSSIAIPSFGNFVPTKTDEEIVIDRTTGKRLLLPPQITVEFHPAAMLRKKINSHE